jgi:hypothetical protein
MKGEMLEYLQECPMSHLMPLPPSDLACALGGGRPLCLGEAPVLGQRRLAGTLGTFFCGEPISAGQAAEVGHIGNTK